MRATCKPLAALTAADLMSLDLVTIPEEMSLRSAADLLSQAQISGAPVVDSQNRCVGMLTATDFVHLVQEGTLTAEQELDSGFAPVCDWEMMNPEHLPADEVRAHMTTDPVTAPPETPISVLARMMIDAHVHRIVILDERRRPKGIVSSTDILAAVARAGSDLMSFDEPGG